MYKKNFWGNPVWQTLAPVQWNCATNERWMMSFCDDENTTDKATNQDWMSFFWNVWTSSSSRLEISDLNDVWHNTSLHNYTVGYKWHSTNVNDSTLSKSAYDKWGPFNGKYRTFVTKAIIARVNN